MQMVCVERHADPIMPKQFHQIALAATEAEDLATMRIAPEALLHRQRQGVHTAPHIRHSARDPHLRARRKRDHCPSTTDRIRASASGATPVGTISRRPLTKTIST